MNKLEKYKKSELCYSIKINILIIILWLSGILFSYLVFLNVHRGMLFDKADYYVNTLSVLSMLVIMFSACMFYFLFNHTCEKNKIAKNIRNSSYISVGLELLNERFVLIDVKNEHYEFLCTMPENDCVLKSGPYSEFLTYLLDAVANDSDKTRLAELLPLKSLTTYLTSNSYMLSIPVELCLQGNKKWDLLSFIVIERDGRNIKKILLSRSST